MILVVTKVDDESWLQLKDELRDDFRVGNIAIDATQTRKLLLGQNLLHQRIILSKKKKNMISLVLSKFEKDRRQKFRFVLIISVYFVLPP